MHAEIAIKLTNIVHHFKLRTTPLQVATRVGFEEAVHLLLECGANINDQDCEGDTAVHDAVRMGKHTIVKDLIIHGADLEIKNKV